MIAPQEFELAGWPKTHMRLVLCSVGIELFAGWMFAAWGLSITLIDQSSSANLLVSVIAARGTIIGPVLSLLGAVWFFVVLKAPQTNLTRLIRKIAQAFGFSFWIGLFTLGLFAARTDPGRVLGVLLYFPLVALLWLALLRRDYPEWT